MDCIFCKIIKGEAPAYKVWQDNDFIAILDINPVLRGHVLLMSKEHYESIYDLPENLYNKIFKRAKFLTEVLKETFSSKKVGLVIEGFGVEHAHIHLMPINNGNELNPLNAKRATDKELEEIQGIIKIRINKIKI